MSRRSHACVRISTRVVGWRPVRSPERGWSSVGNSALRALVICRGEEAPFRSRTREREQADSQGHERLRGSGRRPRSRPSSPLGSSRRARSRISGRTQRNQGLDISANSALRRHGDEGKARGDVPNTNLPSQTRRARPRACSNLSACSSLPPCSGCHAQAPRVQHTRKQVFALAAPRRQRTMSLGFISPCPSCP